MPAVALCPFINDYNDNNGLPNNGGSATIYLTGTTTPAAVYIDVTGTTANTNPVVFNSQGYPIQPIWLPAGAAYDVVSKDALGNQVAFLYNIIIPVDTSQTIVGTAVWIDCLRSVHSTSTTTFTVAGVWDVLLTLNRRIKFVTSGLDPVYGSVADAVYDSGTDKTTVTLVNDGSTVLQNTEAPQQMFYSILDPVNTPIPKIIYYATNNGTADAITANYEPAVYPFEDGIELTVKLPTSNSTTTPTFSPNGLTPAIIVNDDLSALDIGELPQYAELIFDGSNWILKNPNRTSQLSKWSNFPIGYCQPFIPGIMGTDITTWLAAHTGWAKLTNTQVAGIEGRAMAVSSSTHAGNSQAGSDDAVTVAHIHTGTVASHSHPGSQDTGHTHTVTDPSHAHNLLNGAVANPSNSFAGTASVGVWLGTANTAYATTGVTVNAGAANISIAAEAPAVTIASAGVAATDTNIQRTVWFDWIYKIS